MNSTQARVLRRLKGQIPKLDLEEGVIKEGFLREVISKLRSESQGISQRKGG